MFKFYRRYTGCYKLQTSGVPQNVDAVFLPSKHCLHRPKSVNATWPCKALDWIEQGLTSHSTYFRSFRRRWGDCGISQDCSHSQSPQCVRCWVVCARPLLVTVVCMCIIWKALCPYILDARLGLWVSLESITGYLQFQRKITYETLTING